MSERSRSAMAIHTAALFGSLISRSDKRGQSTLATGDVDPRKVTCAHVWTYSPSRKPQTIGPRTRNININPRKQRWLLDGVKDDPEKHNSLSSTLIIPTWVNTQGSSCLFLDTGRGSPPVPLPDSVLSPQRSFDHPYSGTGMLAKKSFTAMTHSHVTVSSLHSRCRFPDLSHLG